MTDSLGAERGATGLNQLTLIAGTTFLRRQSLDTEDRRKKVWKAAWLKCRGLPALLDAVTAADSAVQSSSSKTSAPIDPKPSSKPTRGEPQIPDAFCDCPVQHRSTEKTPVAGNATKSSCDVPQVDRRKADGQGNGKAAKEPIPESETVDVDGTSPMKAKVCTRCKGFKVAQSSRTGFLRKRHAQDATENPKMALQNSTAAVKAKHHENSMEISQDGTKDSARSKQDEAQAQVVSAAESSPPDKVQGAPSTDSVSLSNARTIQQGAVTEALDAGAKSKPPNTIVQSKDTSKKRSPVVELTGPAKKQKRVDVDLTASNGEKMAPVLPQDVEHSRQDAVTEVRNRATKSPAYKATTRSRT